MLSLKDKTQLHEFGHFLRIALTRRHGSDHHGVPFDRMSTASGTYYMDHLHVPNGDVQGRQRKTYSVAEPNLPQRKVSFEVSEARRGSAWASDSNLPDMDQDFEGQQVTYCAMSIFLSPAFAKAWGIVPRFRKSVGTLGQTKKYVYFRLPYDLK